MPIDAFLRALMRDVAWGFFYGTVNFDTVLGTVNHYGTVDLFIGLCNSKAVQRQRVVAKRMVGLPEDIGPRTDQNGYRVNRQFQDVPQDSPELHAEPGFESEVHAFNLFGYLSRSNVTWNPSVCSVVKDSLMCPTTEEYILPIIHGNDRVEWFVQACDEIMWDVEDGSTQIHARRL
jgi:hypothetical protein